MASHLTTEYLDKYGQGKTIIETGTFEGETVKLLQEYGKFDNILSIEINEALYLAAYNMFKNDPRVKLYLGDSIDVLKKIVPHLSEASTFWLDAHASGPYKGGTYPSPLIQELQIIANMKATEMTISTVNGFSQKKGEANPWRTDHTIFIDDKRLMGSQEWGGVSYTEVMETLNKINPNYNIFLLNGHEPNDVICATTRPGPIS